MDHYTFTLLLSPFYSNELFTYLQNFCIENNVSMNSKDIFNILMEINHVIFNVIKKTERLHLDDLCEIILLGSKNGSKNGSKDKNQNEDQNQIQLYTPLIHNILDCNIYIQKIFNVHNQVEKIIHFIIKKLCNEKNTDLFIETNIVSFLLPKSNNFYYITQQYYNENPLDANVTENYVSYYNWLYLYFDIFKK